MTTTTMSADEIQSLYTDGLALQNSGQAEAGAKPKFKPGRLSVKPLPSLPSVTSSATG